MAKNTSDSPGEPFAGFVEQQVSDGRDDSASEQIRAGLRVLEDQEVHLRALREALIEGEASGAAEPFDFAAFLHRTRPSTAR
jgi:antitoxin ParD1/3/4